MKWCEKPEMNSKPVHFLTFVNNGKVFPSLVGMQLPVSWPVSACTKVLISEKVLDFLTPLVTLFIRK